MKDYLRPLFDSFAEKSDPEYALRMKAYMKGKFDYYGLQSKERKTLTKAFFKANPIPEGKLLDVVKGLWDSPQREMQYIAIDILDKNAKICDENYIDFLEELIISKSWWDSVDGLAGWRCGDYFRKYPSKIKEVTRRWTESDNMWLKRSALLFQLRYKSDTDFELMKEYCLYNASSNEFFIRKAIGWALREYSKTDADAVREFAAEAPLSNFSKKEALKWLERSALKNK